MISIDLWIVASHVYCGSHCNVFQILVYFSLHTVRKNMYLMVSYRVFHQGSNLQKSCQITTLSIFFLDGLCSWSWYGNFFLEIWDKVKKKLSEAKPPLFWVQITWKSYLKLFIINYIKSKVELHVMDKHCVEVRMQLQKYNLLKMAVIDVGQNVEQKSMNFSYFFYKTGWKFIAWKLRKKRVC